MHSITAENVNTALCQGLRYLAGHGEIETSRNGSVIVAPVPVTTTYLHPLERVLFSPLRDANPFFHLMESLWMLDGRNDVEWPSYFAKNLANYSDDGATLHGAYGFRWRRWFEYDQLALIAAELRKNPDSRRCVLTMWDARLGDGAFKVTELDSDLHVAISGGKDVPCNTHAYFDCRHGKVNMTVCCRSNDVIWGAYGANVVHFSFLLELIAAWVGLPVGVYRQMSNNYHAYLNCIPLENYEAYAEDALATNHYSGFLPNEKYVVPLVSRTVPLFLEELHSFMKEPTDKRNIFLEPFITDVAQPMFEAWQARKDKTGNGEREAGNIRAWDWRIACLGWIDRHDTMLAMKARLAPKEQGNG